MIYQLAGILKMDPSPFTVRELLIMAEAARRDAWDRLSVLLSLVYNAHRGPKAPYLAPEAFNPYTVQTAKNAKPMVGIEALKIFVPK